MNKIITPFIYFLSILILLSLGWWGNEMFKNYLDKDLTLPNWNKPKPLEKYTIENLSKTEIKSVPITIDGNIFSFEFDPTLEYKKNAQLKKVTGYINTDKSDKKQPIVILLRGYVDKSIYQSGVGTKRVGENLSQNGYITLAPDFLGYAGSSIESSNIFEARFQTYTTTLTLIKSINKENFPNWDGKNIFIWGHSNGGQITLTVLEILGMSNPDLIQGSVLWAPVTENFPYSVLFYTNESEDNGKYIRRELSKFETEYDVEKYSLTNYLDKITAPIEYHYGTNDDAIPYEWRDRFVTKMKSLHPTFTNYNHSGADHNMNPLWSDVMKNTLNFFEKQKS